MPILFMALSALLIFLVMGFMLFYAAYAESHTPHPGDGDEKQARGAVRR